MKRHYFFLVITCVIATLYASAGAKIVVLGSSTAAGSGPVNKANAWVARYSTYLRSIDATHSLTNLAKGGSVTFQAMPSDYVSSKWSSYLPDTLHNITMALSLSPNAIIINFPSNDVSAGISVDEQIQNYNVMIAKAKEVNVPVWICTSQPVNYGTSQMARDKIKALKERIQVEYKEMSIDFYSGLSDGDGKILAEYDSGDGLHLNDAAHGILYDRVVAASILSRIGFDPTDSSGMKLLKDPVLIDFGATVSPAPWNNITNISATGVGSRVDDLTDVNANPTGIAIEVSKSFYGMNTLGPTVTSTTLNMPASVSTDNFYTGGGFGELFLTGLNPDQYFTFVFFGSRIDQYGLSREAKLTVRGNNILSGTIETRSNYSNMLVLQGIKPATNKSVSIELTHGPGNQNASYYAHLTALKIFPETTSSVQLENQQMLSLWNEGGKVYASFSGNGRIDIVNLTGQLVYTHLYSHRESIETVQLCPPESGMLIVLFRSAFGVTARKVLFS